MAAVTAECRSERVDATTRAVNVEALNSCSAYTIIEKSSDRAASGVGLVPRSMNNRFAACELSGSGASGSLPCNRRYRAAITTGSCAIKRSAFRKLASRLLSR